MCGVLSSLPLSAFRLGWLRACMHQPWLRQERCLTRREALSVYPSSIDADLALLRELQPGTRKHMAVQACPTPCVPASCRARASALAPCLPQGPRLGSPLLPCPLLAPVPLRLQACQKTCPVNGTWLCVLTGLIPACRCA